MLNQPVLMLNRSWVAVHVATVRRAVVMLFEGSAEVVCTETYRTYDFDAWRRASESAVERCIRAPGFRLRAPEVMVLVDFNRVIRRPIRYNRRNVFIRDRYTCQYCGRRFPEKELTIEHIVPVSKGGSDSWSNTATACKACNKRKSNRTPEQAGMRLLSLPRKPTKTYSTMPPVRKIRESWMRFLDGGSVRQYGMQEQVRVDEAAPAGA